MTEISPCKPGRLPSSNPEIQLRGSTPARQICFQLEEPIMKITHQLALACALSFAALFSAVPSQAHEIKLGNLVIHHPWIKQPPGSAAVAGAYTTIDNNGKQDDTLLSVSVDGVSMAMIHEMKMQGDVMKMNELPGGLVIPAGKSVELKPKSYHIMLMGLKSAFMEGEEVKGSFTFAKTGKVDVDFEVVAPGADVPMKH
jgi:copper(I)-binding protein